MSMSPAALVLMSGHGGHPERPIAGKQRHKPIGKSEERLGKERLNISLQSYGGGTVIDL